MDKNTIILASTNAGKILELKEPLQVLGLNILGLDSFPKLQPAEETGSTFAENAYLKAKAISDATGLIAIADDSGLEVDALGGLPGVHSARYSLPDEFTGELAKLTQDEKNILKLISALRNIPLSERSARFCTCMVAIFPNGQSITTHGYWEGRIVSTPRGKNGFGYDPIFFDPNLGRTAAELSLEEKRANSHRGKALNQLLEAFRDKAERQ